MNASRCNSSRGSHAGERLALLVAVWSVVITGALGAQERTGPVRPIGALDLERYAGRWHEVARLPNRFQSRCVGNVTATYEAQGEGLRVVNECATADGGSIRAEGRARRADPSEPASRLKVRFAPALLSFLPIVWADYWVLDLTDDYGAALVGTPDRRFLWVLSRQPELDPATYERLVDTAARQGFDVTRLQRTSARPAA